jgi:hypothetical protein
MFSQKFSGLEQLEKKLGFFSLSTNQPFFSNPTPPQTKNNPFVV